MDKKKIIYIGLILILTVIVSITYFSYAFFTSRYEQRGKLNIVTGTLNYEIESSDLVNNTITLESNKSKQIEIEITSLNEINSKYELYYQTSNNAIEVGYGSDNDTPTGTINHNNKKIVKVVIKNKSTNSATITFGVEGGFINNTLVLSTGNHITNIINTLCDYDSGYTWNFPFDPDGDGQGQAQSFTVPCDGNYKIELWGASGGGNTGSGFGGYVSGNIELITNKFLYFYVGNQPTLQTNSFNGGGDTNNSHYPTYDGGGATDVRLVNGTWDNFESLKSRIMVAAAAGGSEKYSTGKNGGSAGGLIGYNGDYSGSYDGTGTIPTGGTQISGGVRDYQGASGINGTFGKGGNGDLAYGGGGGGSGYYGGGGGGNYHHVSSGGGGSSYISGHDGCDAIDKDSTVNSIIHTGQSVHFSGYRFTDTVMIDGSGYSWTNVKGPLEQMPNPNGGYYASGTGHTGNGYARITYLGE